MTALLRPVLTCALLPLLCLGLLGLPALAQDGPPARERQRPAAGPDRGERPQRGDRGDMLGQMLERDPSEGLIRLLTDLNMTPEFTLSPEQKTQIQNLREKFRTERQAFVAENQKQMDFIRAQMTEAREARDREAMGEAMESLRDLMAKGPTGEKLNDDLKAVLTDAQRKLVDQRLEEREQRMREWREQRERQRDNRGGDNNQGPDI